MSEPFIRVVISMPVGTATLTLYASPPNEEVALQFYDWLKAHKFKVAIVGASDMVLVNSAQGQVIVDALVNQFAEDMGAGREADGLEG
jgi:hypothetical protein